MSQPTPEQQVEFLMRVQRLLQEGQFVATYKFALLLALADISVEEADDSGDAIEISTTKIAEKFVHYYWKQAVPYVAGTDLNILRQNTGNQAGILRLVQSARSRHGDSLPYLRQNLTAWRKLVKEVERIVCVMPLWKLQTVGRHKLDFLYENVEKGRTVSFKPGVAFCLRKFHGIISDLVQSAWVNYVRRVNLEVLGTTTDLHEFLFGAERNVLAAVVPVLNDVQHGRCFYCAKDLKRGTIHVDHFIPWSRYPVDLAHNFVLADTSCNTSKGSRLAATEHLDRWIERNHSHGNDLAVAFSNVGVIHNLPASMRVAQWAYTQAAFSGGLGWKRGEELLPIKRWLQG